MAEVDKLSAQYEDLRLTVVRQGLFWRVRVEEVDDPESVLSGGQEYPSVERAKEGARSVALELFGTGVVAEDLDWQPTD